MQKRSIRNRNRKRKNNTEVQVITRVRLPQGQEALGVVEQRVGGSRMIVRCFDGVSRNCRVPGRLRRSLWLREGDLVIVEPWEFDKTKGDILFKYNPNQVDWMKRKGYLNEIEEL